MHRNGLVLASFAADSLALGAHWMYDTDTIEHDHGVIDKYLAPRANSYHGNRQRGDFSHYGDQTLLLLASIPANTPFSVDRFARSWQATMHSYDGYLDKATRQTLLQLKEGNPLQHSGSSSSDLGGAARIAPLVYAYHDSPAMLLEAVQAQTAFTHNNKAVIGGAEFLAKTSVNVLHGQSPAAAIEQIIDDVSLEIDLDMKIRAALDSAGTNSTKAIKGFGAGCSISSALPGVVHLVVSYPDDLKTALVENVMAGGDSAARGLAAGMILGARNGCEAIPDEWLSEMRAYRKIMTLLEQLK